MDTHDLVFFSPTTHELLDVGVVQRFVKVLLNVVGASACNGGM
jgi:hypothetical protein